MSVLLPADLHTGPVLRLTAYYDARLKNLREMNDHFKRTAEATALLRGEIFEVKHILDLLALRDSPSAPPESDETK